MRYGLARTADHLGRGWIQVGVDPTYYPLGYSVSDTWGDAFDLMN